MNTHQIPIRHSNNRCDNTVVPALLNVDSLSWKNQFRRESTKQIVTANGRLFTQLEEKEEN